MAKNSEFQKIYLRSEAVAGNTVATFADGVLVRTVGLVDPSSIKHELVDAGVVKLDANDAGVSPALGLDVGEVSVVINMSGAARDVSDVITTDNLSTLLAATVGTRDSTANGVCLADCTTSAIKMTDHPYEHGDLVNIGGETRKVETDTGANEFALDFPLSAAPSVGTVIYGVEWFDPQTDTPLTVGLGISQVDTELQYICRKCNVPSVEVKPFAPGEIGQLTMKIAIGSFTTEAITPATDVAGDKALVTGKSGPGLQLKAAAGTLLKPSIATITASLGTKREYEQDMSSSMSKGSVVAGPSDSVVEFTANQESLYSALVALQPTDLAAGASTPILVQTGSAIKAAWGVYFPEAFLSDGPTAEKIGIVQGVKAQFKATRGILFRV